LPRKQIPPTRSNYLRIQESLERARRGYDLLERKRQILVMELMDRMEAARSTQQRVQEQMADAFEALKSAARLAGAERLFREGAGISTDLSLNIRSKSVMGVSIPNISFRSEEEEMPFGLLPGAGGADEVRSEFKEALESIVQLAELENAVMRIAQEIKKTQRRVRALENTFIPQYEDTLKFIGDSLEEREREELVTMKKVKQMREGGPGNSPNSGGEERHG
jgi:V/A-type H+-transporting ATPase subunit D